VKSSSPPELFPTAVRNRKAHDALNLSREMEDASLHDWGVSHPGEIDRYDVQRTSARKNRPDPVDASSKLKWSANITLVATVDQPLRSLEADKTTF